MVDSIDSVVDSLSVYYEQLLSVVVGNKMSCSLSISLGFSLRTHKMCGHEVRSLVIESRDVK